MRFSRYMLAIVHLFGYAMAARIAIESTDFMKGA